MSLYFTIRDEPAIETKLLERKVDAYVAGIDLETPSDLATAVGEVLSRIANGSNGTKKRELAKALGETSVTPHKPRDVTIKEFVSATTFYNKNKNWIHDPDYREVLEIVIALYRKWDGGSGARELAAHQQEWREKTRKMSNDLMEMAAELLVSTRVMVQQPLVEQTVTDEHGREITRSPARWTQDTANKRAESLTKVVETADKLARMSLDMATDRTEQSIVTADVTDKVQKVTDTRESLKETLNSMRESMIQPIGAVGEDTESDEEE